MLLSKLSIVSLSLLPLIFWGSAFLVFFFFSLCSSFFLGVLVFSLSFMFCWASQYHGWLAQQNIKEFPHYCESSERNSVCRLMFDLNIHRLLGADDISGAVWYMVNATHVEGPWTWVSVSLSFNPLLRFVFGLLFSFLEGWVFSFLWLPIGCWYDVRSGVSITLLVGCLSIH